MSYPIEDTLVIPVASSAPFDLTESDRSFGEQGGWRANVSALEPARDSGADVAFLFIRRLLSLHAGADDQPIEVVLLSRNDPDPRVPAGMVLSSAYEDDRDDPELRVAFDFDGILADHDAEQVPGRVERRSDASLSLLTAQIALWETSDGRI